MNTENSLQNVQSIAKKHYDGHFTLFSFTTNFKGCFGTPYGENLRELLNVLPVYQSMEDLLLAMSENPQMFDYYAIEQRI